MIGRWAAAQSVAWHTTRPAALSRPDDARPLPADAGAAIGWVQGSVLSLPFAAASYGVVLCQLGLQFVPDQSAALAQMRRMLAPAGRLGLNVYGPIEHNQRHSRWHRHSIANWTWIRR